ncbi:MAG: SpoIIE family protein phosphatase [Spirochaetes bacterium]|nr:SpoIIE family protein phosphatase [Spirochaetota bacterium]
MDQLFQAQSVFIIPPVVSLAFGIAIALISLVKGRWRLENILFAVLCLWWSLLNVAFISHHLFRGNEELIMRIERVVHFFFVYLPAVNLFFFFRMTGTRSRVILPAAVVASFLFSLTTWTEWYFNGLYTYSWGYIARGGIAFQIFSIYGTSVVLYLFYFFIKKMRSERNQIIRLKLRYILLAFLLNGFLTIFNFPAMNGMDFYPIGNVAFLPLAFLAYGVLSHRLMEVRSVLHISLMWAVMSSLLLVPNAMLFYFIYPHVKNLGTAALFALCVLWFFANYIYLRLVQPRIDQLFNRRRYDLNRLGESFIGSISSLQTLDDLINQLTSLVKRSLNFGSAEIILCHENVASLTNSLRIDCDLDPAVSLWFVKANHLVDRAMVESNPDYENDRDRLLPLFDRYDAVFLVPFVQKGDLLALMALPEKLNLRPLASFEVNYLNKIRTAASIALDNSVLYGNLAMMKESLAQMVEERTSELKRAMDALWGEMELARKIQTVLLPRSPAIRGFEIAAYMRPADEVGGDYYDVINAEGIDWLVIGDVSGHGVAAGLIMMMVQTAIHIVITGKPNLKPEVVLERVNSVITQNIRRLNEDRYMTITVIACLNGGAFHFSGQHENIMIHRLASGAVELVETEGIWLGISETMRPPAAGGFSLERGDTLLLYTDGITEAWRKGSIRDQRDPESEMFGMERLRSIFQRLGGSPPDAIRDGILAELEGYSPADDITMLILRRA